MDKKISVIVPVYKVEDYLEKCVNSILDQTYRNLEIILVDDGSPDKCPEICDNLAQKDKRIKVIHKKNGGVSSARNLGIESATGDFITFVDSDDWIDLEMYEELYKKQQENNYDVVFCGFKLIINDKSIPVIETSKTEFCKNNNIEYLLRCTNYKNKNNQYYTENSIHPFNVRFLYKKDMLRNIRFNENLSLMEDVRLMLEIFLNKTLNIGYLDNCFYNYLVREISLSNGKINNLMEKGILFIESISELLKNTGNEYLINAQKFYIYYMCSVNNIRYDSKDNLKSINDWNSKQNYKNYKKYLTNGFKSKLRIFLIHYHLGFVFKIAIKLKKIIKGK